MMESFKFLYLEACENLNTNPCEKLLSRIEDVGNSNSFNLLGIQLTNETCKAFGQALKKDVHIQELDCSNCMFSEEGLINILLGLEKNKFLLTLNLKGNNIRSSGTEVLGKFLRHNSHLQKYEIFIFISNSVLYILRDNFVYSRLLYFS
ncbi:leucine-rich repeat-containing protein 45 [Trichonephila clavata]|uniref:Leucine-rich repeat-containing protein 45 n=1 Tax=Trichonephila clavata TaxID=2740835 RepID=A0A8X6M3X3_TRICU|nr:leucine-rich repeat-containing protein 45 [Trichonephila clavata]